MQFPNLTPHYPQIICHLFTFLPFPSLFYLPLFPTSLSRKLKKNVTRERNRKREQEREREREWERAWRMMRKIQSDSTYWIHKVVNAEGKVRGNRKTLLLLSIRGVKKVTLGCLREKKWTTLVLLLLLLIRGAKRVMLVCLREKK